MNLEEKLRMAEALHDLGADVLEAGFAIASPGDFESVQSIARRFAKDGPVIASLSRANTADILSSAEATKPAARPRIHIVLATSDLHMRVKLRMTRDEVLERITQSVPPLPQPSPDVEWVTAEDGTRSDLDIPLPQPARPRSRPGATTINIPDTVGYSLPRRHARDLLDAEINQGAGGGEGDLLHPTTTTISASPWRTPWAAIQGPGCARWNAPINGIGERGRQCHLGRSRWRCNDRAATCCKPGPASSASASSRPRSCWRPSRGFRRAAEQGDRRAQRLPP